MAWQAALKTAATHLAANHIQRRTRQSRTPIPVWVIAISPVGVAALVALLGVAAIATPNQATTAAALGIPHPVFAAYLNAQQRIARLELGCVVDWSVIAGIWDIESSHGTYQGRSVSNDGDVTPPLFGIALDGTTPGTATIPDTDDGALDEDTTWDRAVGPAQFLPATWIRHGTDGNHDTIANPQNVYDAALTTAVYLCRSAPGDYADPTVLAVALRRYNNSSHYVDVVTERITYYRTFTITAGVLTANGRYTFPLPHDAIGLSQIRRTHHDYPASDLTVPEGTVVYAVHGGTVTGLTRTCPNPMQCRCGNGVTITGNDHHRYTYCHASELHPTVALGADVVAGQAIMLSGDTGNSLRPHLHLQIRNPNGTLICPQRLLEAWYHGIALHPANDPTTGCTH